MKVGKLLGLAALAPGVASAADFSGTWRIDDLFNRASAADGTLKGNVLRNGSPSPITAVKQ